MNEPSRSRRLILRLPFGLLTCLAEHVNLPGERLLQNLFQIFAEMPTVPRPVWLAERLLLLP